MRTTRYAFACGLALLTGAVSAQIAFTDNTSLLNGSYNSGGVTGVVDMNGDGMDDIIILDIARELVIEYQQADGSFTRADFGALSSNNQWGAAVGDFDKDGHKDVFSGGSYDGVHCLLIDPQGGSTMVQLNNGAMFMQCANVADMNNDGWLDAMGCHDDADSRIWLNDQAGLLEWDPFIDFTSNPVSDMSGNYGSCWTDFDNDGDLDLYIAKCRQGVNDPADPRRINVLYVNDGNNNFTNEADARGIAVDDQSWSADFGDIDNDGDLDLVVTNHDNNMRLFENDGTGHFTDITLGSGIGEVGFFLQSIFRDFDNDGFLDLLVSGGVNYLFKGNGDGTFSDVSTAILANDDLHSFGIGDLNGDGFLDYYASYGDTYVNPDMANPDRLWLNDGNANNWIAFTLEGVQSNLDAIGAQTRIYGPWGIQMREVRSGESYGIMNSFTANFGIGAETAIDSVVVNWPSGTRDVYTNVTTNAYHHIVEGQCIAPAISVSLSASAAIVCTGGTPLTLTANSGFTYLWSTGETTQSIDVTTAGVVTVTIDDGSGCTNSMSVNVVADPDETPTITSDMGTDICTGDMLMLSTATTTPVTWSTGETTPSISVTQAGPYTVSTQGVCAMFTSAAFNVTVHPIPAAPTTTGDNLPAAGTGTVTATGTNIEWYDAATGGVLIGTGSPWTTPSVAVTASFWAQDVAPVSAAANGGKLDNDPVNGGIFNNNNRYLYFDAYEGFTIQSVKVYADGDATREFAVVDEVSGATVSQGSFFVVDGESRVNVGLVVPTAGQYTLRALDNAPALWRDGQGSNPAFPFALGNVGSITNSNAGNGTEFYYFWYDWQVTPLNQCASPRTEAVVQVAVGIDELSNTQIQVWPNPSNGVVQLTLDKHIGDFFTEVLDLTGRVVWSRSITQADAANGAVALDLSGMAKGEYILQVTTTTGSLAQRVVLQ